MKRYLCLILVLCLLLAGCGKKTAEAPTEPATVPTTAATEAPTTEAPTTEATEPVTEPTQPPQPMNPLTGEPLEEFYTGRPVSFTLNNIVTCLPQYGLDDLDWMFEVETEGGITRCLGIMTDPTKADVVGPIRSARSYFLNLSVSYNAPLFHCGGSAAADACLYSFSDADKVESWDHADQMTYASSYFYRDSNRYNNLGYDWEHTLFTSGELLAQGMTDFGFSATSGEPVSYGYQFSETVELDGVVANTVSIEFLGGKDTDMVYNSDTGLYAAYQDGSDWVDGSTGENATFRNVLVILSPQSKPVDYHSFYELDGPGDGYFAVDGQMIPIKWHHKDVDGPFRFTLADGTTPITLGIGKTYCAIVSTNGSVIAE